MKKRAAVTLFTLMMLLSACGENTAQHADRVSAFYGSLSSYSSVASVTLDHGDYLTDYVLIHRYSENTHTVTVKEPLSMAGLTMTADGESLELSFGDAVFLPQSLDGTGATPVKLLPDMLASLSTGNYEAICLFTEEGRQLLSLSVWSEVDGDEFMHRITLDTETLLPVSAEVFFDGRSVMTAKFSESAATALPENDRQGTNQ